jgi:glutamate transport system ATP-binding protein
MSPQMTHVPDSGLAAADRADVVQMSGVRKAYGPTIALDNVDLTVRRGDVILLVGSSGSGKSTLLRTINSLEQIDAGEIFVCGERVGYQGGVNGTPRKRLGESRLALQRRRTAMVFQHFNLFTNMTCLENVASGLRYVRKVKPQAANVRAMELLDSVGLPDKWNKYPQQLSGGQMQRIGIARALAMEPEIMLLDEPTSALDPETVQEVLDVLIRLHHEGMTMLVASHEMRFAKAAANEVIFMNQGKIVERGTPTEFFDHPKTQRAKEFLSKVL